MDSRKRYRIAATVLALVLIGHTSCAHAPETPGAAVLPGVEAVAADPGEPADAQVIAGNWPDADGRRLIELADMLDAKNADAPRNGPATGVLVVLDPEAQEWLHARLVRPTAKVGGSGTAAALRLAGEAVQATKQRMAGLALGDGSVGHRAEQVDAAGDALDALLALTGARIGLPVG